MVEAIYALLTSAVILFSGDKKEDTYEQQNRLYKTAYVINKATSVASDWDPKESAVFLVTLGEFETHYASLIGADNCREHARLYKSNCDGFRAKSYWQMHRGVAPRTHRADPGSDTQLFYAAHESMAWAARARKQCGGTIEGAFSGYREMKCDWPEAKIRAQRYRVLYEKFTQILESKKPKKD